MGRPNAKAPVLVVNEAVPDPGEPLDVATFDADTDDTRPVVFSSASAAAFHPSNFDASGSGTTVEASPVNRHC